MKMNESQKKYARGRVMRLNTFEMQKMNEIGRNEAGEWRVFLSCGWEQ